MQALNCGLFYLFLTTFSQANLVQCELNATVDNGECESAAPSLVQKRGSNRIGKVHAERDPEGRIVQIQCGNGRLGNNLHSLMHGMVFAKQIHATQVEVTKDIGQLAKILNIPDTNHFEIPQTDETRWAPIPTECNKADTESKIRDNYWSGGYWQYYCAASARVYHATALEMVRPMFKPELSACAEGSHEGENPDETLTVHLRGNDMWGARESNGSITDELDMQSAPNHWLWNHPPCSMYKKIITEEGFKHVVLVTSPDQRHPCIKWSWFQDRVKEGAITLRVQSGTLLEDACALLQAHNLVLSYSTFPEATAVLSSRVKRIFSRKRFQDNSVMDGNGWEGTTVHQYSMPVSEDIVNDVSLLERYPNTMAGLIDWYLNYPDGEIKLVPRSSSSSDEH